MGCIELCDDCIAQRQTPTQILIEFGGILLVSVSVLLSGSVSAPLKLMRPLLTNQLCFDVVVIIVCGQSS